MNWIRITWKIKSVYSMIWKMSFYKLQKSNSTHKEPLITERGICENKDIWVILFRIFFISRFSNMHFIFISIGFCLSFLGCAQKNVDMKNFFVQRPSSKWFEIKEGGADFAWYNKEIYGAIYIDSNCKQKFEDRPLKDSYLSLTQGITTGTPIQQNKRIIDGREALFSVQNGVIDGITVRLASVVLSKDECLYDFSLAITL